MNGGTCGRVAALALALGLVSPAGAEWFNTPRHDKNDCPPSNYSCLHYFAPSLYRYRAFHSEHPEYLYAQVPFPEMVQYESFAAPCPAVDPAVLARYSLRYAYTGSTYQGQPAAAEKGKDEAAVPNGSKSPGSDKGAAARPERLPPPKKTDK